MELKQSNKPQTQSLFANRPNPSSQQVERTKQTHNLDGDNIKLINKMAYMQLNMNLNNQFGLQVDDSTPEEKMQFLKLFFTIRRVQRKFKLLLKKRR